MSRVRVSEACMTASDTPGAFGSEKGTSTRSRLGKKGVMEADNDWCLMRAREGRDCVIHGLHVPKLYRLKVEPLPLHQRSVYQSDTPYSLPSWPRSGDKPVSRLDLARLCCNASKQGFWAFRTPLTAVASYMRISTAPG